MEDEMKEANWFKHDFAARRDPKVQALRLKYGAEGYGAYFMLIELMAETPGHKIKKFPVMVQSLSAELGVSPEKMDTMLSYIINECELLTQDDGFIWSDSLLRRLEVYNEICDKRRESGRRGGEISAEVRKSKQNPSKLNQMSSNCLNQTKQPSSKLNQIREDEIREDKNISSEGLDSGFSKFWEAYPNKVGYGAAEDAWYAVNPPLDAVLEALKWQVGKFESAGPQFTPSPSNWIRHKRWTDSKQEVKSAAMPSYVEPLELRRGQAYKSFCLANIENRKCKLCGMTASIMGCNCENFVTGAKKAEESVK